MCSTYSSAVPVKSPSVRQQRGSKHFVLLRPRSYLEGCERQPSRPQEIIPGLHPLPARRAEGAGRPAWWAPGCGPGDGGNVHRNGTSSYPTIPNQREPFQIRPPELTNPNVCYTCSYHFILASACPFSVASPSSEFSGLIVLCWCSSSPRSPFPSPRNNLVVIEGSVPVPQPWRRQEDGRCDRKGAVGLFVCTGDVQCAAEH